MPNHKVLIGDVSNGLPSHSQAAWQAGDRVTDPAGNQLAKTSEVSAAATGIQGAVDTYAELPDPTTLGLGILYIVRQDAGAPSGDGLYRVEDSGGTNVWVFLDKLNLQDAGEVPYSNATSGLTATDVQAALDEIDSAVDDKAEDAYLDNSFTGPIDTAPLDPNGTAGGSWFPFGPGEPYEMVDDAIRDPNTPDTGDYVEWDSSIHANNDHIEFELATVALDGGRVNEVTVRAYCSATDADMDVALNIGGTYTQVQTLLTNGGANGWRTATFNATTDPTLFPILQANLDSLKVRFRGSTTNEPPGPRVELYAAYADVTYDGGSAWSTSSPTTLQAALDRLANQVAAHFGTKIPA